MNVNSICISLFLSLFSVPEICLAADVAGNAHGMVRLAKTKQGYAFYEGRNKIMSYQQQYKAQKGKYRRCHYIHPLYGLDGEVLTEDFPADHPHHRGIFWGWHQLWLGDKKVGDGVEFILKKIQARRINPYQPGGRVVFDDRQLEFHPDSPEKWILEKYNQKMKELGLAELGQERDSGLTI